MQVLVGDLARAAEDVNRHAPDHFPQVVLHVLVPDNLRVNSKTHELLSLIAYTYEN